MKRQTIYKAPGWDGVERRLAGNYHGRIAFLLPGQAVEKHSAVVLQALPNKQGPRKKTRSAS